MRRVVFGAVILSLLATAVVLQGCASSPTVATKRLERGERWTASSEGPVKEYCTSTREYVTALEFLRGHAEFSLNDAQAQDVAEKIAKGCTGAADRFARVAGMLLKANVGSKDSVRVGMEFALKTDAQAQGFVTVFRYSYLQSYLDMDPFSALQLAHSVTANYTGDVDQARSDFVRIVQFCMDRDGLDLPRPQCGAMAARIAQMGSDFEKGIAQEFIEFYRFAVSSSGPSLTAGDALRLAQQTVEKGPTAPANFKDAYRYGVSNSGLKLTQSDALKFAQKMAEGSTAGVPELESRRVRGLASKSQ